MNNECHRERSVLWKLQSVYCVSDDNHEVTVEGNNYYHEQQQMEILYDIVHSHTH
jgi:hypothetical protein